MCPDRQILSIYVDNELPSPWREKLEAHLETCADCRKSWRLYQQLKLDSVPEPISPETLEAVKARVWKRLSVLGTVKTTPVVLWRRALQIPIPLAAALVFLLIAGGWLLRPRTTVNDQTIAEIGYDRSKVVPVSNVDDVLKYLETQDSQTEIIIIRLPENHYFNMLGEPSLIRAADYTGRPTH